MIFIYSLLFLILTYFICAIPFGLLVTKIFLNQDIRKSGSGNIGATNVARIAGKKLGLLTLILDSTKGAIMVILARFIFDSLTNLHLFLLTVSMVAILAHIYPIYLNFKGGKGVATTIATFLVLDPIVGFLVVVVWILTFTISRISSISSMIAIISSVLFSIHYSASLSQIIFSILVSGLILLKHKENIMRLITGEEKKF